MQNKTSNQKKKTFHSIQIQKDAFLRRKQIQVERSQFLANHYAAKSFNLKQSYNPKDKYGKRMSSYWTENDTITSVILKKMKRNLIKIFNPDTYTKKQLISMKQQILKDKFNMIALVLIILVPIAITHPIIKPRLNAIRREMIFQYYLQSGMISRQLKTPLHKISKEQMQRIINQASQRVGF